ncbi:MAG: DUF3696 domain-containing protein [Balneolales bacterium]|nr:DUF3696 domain-containing protein [Balneolales bacterium]
MKDIFEGFFFNSTNRIRLIELSIKNYRSFKEPVRVKNKPLTLLFGGNSAGKSSLLRLFSYLDGAAKSRMWNVNNSVRLEDLIYQKDGKNLIELKYRVFHHFESDLEFEGETMHKAVYDIKVELELKSVQEGLDNSLYFKESMNKSLFDDDRPHERVEVFDQARRQKVRPTAFNMYDFVERKIIVYETLHHAERKETKRLIELQFYNVDGITLVKEGFINPYTPLALTELAFDDKTNVSKRIENNVGDIREKWLASFFEYCAIINEWEVAEEETQTIGEKNEVFIRAKGGSYHIMAKVRNVTGIGLFGSFKALMNSLARRIGHTGPQNNQITIPESMLSGTPKLSEKRKNKVVFKRFAAFNGAFLTHIQNILEAPFRNMNGLYVAGIREVLSDSTSLYSFCGILQNPETQSQEAGILKQINVLLGPAGLGTSYEVKYKRGATEKEIENLSAKLKKRGLEGDRLYSVLLSEGLVHKYELYDTVTDTPVKRSEVGLGIVQVLPIISNMAAHEKALLVIEQPELHLHPAQQSKLAQLVIENYTSKGNRFMIETHSEHFIKTLQLEIARNSTKASSEKGLDKDDIQILFVDRNEDIGGSYAREIKLTEDGSFSEPWPDNFFDASADITLERLRITNRN